MKLPKIPLALAVASVLATSLDAAVFTLNPTNPSGTAGFQDFDFDGVGDGVIANEGFPAFGSFGTGNFSVSGGFSFVLPVLPVGEIIQSVTFRAFYEGGNGDVPGEADFYGIRKDASPAFLNSDYGVGTAQTGVLLGDNLALSGGSYITPVNVTSFVAAGYLAGDTAFFRVSSDADAASVNAAGVRQFFQGASQSNKPELVITTAVPEPTVALTLLSGLGLLGSLRRRRTP